MDTFDGGQDQAAEDLSGSEEVGNSQEVETGQHEDLQSQEGGINPVWDPIRQELGLQFEAIKPHLLEIDKGFNQGITKANEKYTPWKAFDEQGITPDAINQSFAVLQKLNDSPEEVYAALGQFLQENGRLPKNAQEAEQALEDADGAGDEFETPEQQALRQLQEQQEQMQNFLQAQQQEQQMAVLNAKAEQEVAQEYDTFEKAHPDLTQAEKQMVYQQHFLYAQAGPDKIRSLEDVYNEVNGFKNSILSTPRPNDLAPRLPGAGGGVPTGQRKDMAELSREESQDVLANLLIQARDNK